MKTNISISRLFHDHLLKMNEDELNRMYRLHEVKWSVSGPSFIDVGSWYRNWIQSEHLRFIEHRRDELGFRQKEDGLHLSVRYVK